MVCAKCRGKCPNYDKSRLIWLLFGIVFLFAINITMISFLSLYSDKEPNWVLATNSLICISTIMLNIFMMISFNDYHNKNICDFSEDFMAFIMISIYLIGSLCGIIAFSQHEPNPYKITNTTTPLYFIVLINTHVIFLLVFGLISLCVFCGYDIVKLRFKVSDDIDASLVISNKIANTDYQTMKMNIVSEIEKTNNNELKKSLGEYYLIHHRNHPDWFEVLMSLSVRGHDMQEYIQKILLIDRNMLIEVLSEYIKQETTIHKLTERNLELECRPPERGGPVFESAASEFVNNAANQTRHETVLIDTSGVNGIEIQDSSGSIV
jgi:hypothetical protein